jgi:hypothetical protein
MFAGDISNYNQSNDWLPIIASVVVLEALLILCFKYFPGFWGLDINLWYDKFGLLAVISDALIVLIGFALTRYVYTAYLQKRYGWSPLLFIGVFLAIQIVHDILFWFLTVVPLPEGNNAIIDAMKRYGSAVSYKAILGDSMMVVLMTALAIYLKGFPAHVSIFVALMGVYMTPYVLTTKTKL